MAAKLERYALIAGKLCSYLCSYIYETIFDKFTHGLEVIDFFHFAFVYIIYAIDVLPHFLNQSRLQ